MNQGLLLITLIGGLALFLIPGFFVITQLFNDGPERQEENSGVLFIKTEIKMKLLTFLKDYSKANNFSIEEFSKNLRTSHQTVVNILNQRADRFTIDLLIDLVLRTGGSVKIIIKNKDEQE